MQILVVQILLFSMGMCMIAKSQSKGMDSCKSGGNEMSAQLRGQIKSELQNSSESTIFDNKTAYFQKTRGEDITLGYEGQPKRKSLVQQNKEGRMVKMQDNTNNENSSYSDSPQAQNLAQFSFQNPNYSVEDYNILNEVSSDHHKQMILATMEKSTPVTLQKILFNNGSTYQGQWLNGKRHGKGVHVNAQGTYEGRWEQNEMVGHGIFYFNNKDKYEGDFLQSMMHGKGKFQQHSGAIYQGEFRLNKKHGFGIQVYDVGEYYEGQWKDGYKNGKGLLQFKDGSYVKGSFHDNCINGFAEYYWAGKKRFKGEWVLNKLQGYGVMEWEDGRKYEGHYVNDKMEGKGVYSFKNGQQFTGMWKYNKKNGKGEYVDQKGNIRRGLWYQDRLIEQYGLASKKRLGISSLPK